VHWRSERPLRVNGSEEPLITHFERGHPIRAWQPKRDGEHIQALDTFVCANAPRLQGAGVIRSVLMA